MPSPSSLLLLERSRTFSNLLRSNFSFIRRMGGGPRTFPGGLNKWQWKRLHEKKAKEKEQKLLRHEKQLYEARIRSEIRAKLAGRSDPPSDGPDASKSFSAMTPKDHVKALADRFMKEGAEDLWNEDDGPVKPPNPRSRPMIRSADSPLDLGKIVSGQHDFDLSGRRHYTVEAGRRSRSRVGFRVTGSSSSGDEGDFGFQAAGSSRWPRFKTDKGEPNSEGRISRKKLMSSAALGEYDAKVKRWAPKAYERGDVLSEEVRLIRDEVNLRNLAGNEHKRNEEKEESLLSQKRFDECNISPLTIKALSLAGYVQMTMVQESALPSCLDGKDVLVKAKTGTGKSAAFLLPAIETVLMATSSSMNQRVPPILALVLCPTRELASQIAAEANVFLKYHDGIGVQTLIGGTRFKIDQKHLESDPCQIIVATPGRLLDHIENKSGFSMRLMGLKVLILDEADHLLDLGFRKDIEKIVDCVPRQRQSLLFSATIPKEVRRISQLVLKRDHVFIDTVGLGGLETHAKVLQSYLVAPHEHHFHIVHYLLKEHITRVIDYKVIVFCTTAMVTSLLFLLLRELKMNVREMHSRKPQLYRTRISDEFRESKRLILVTSDVSARGMNYPDVTLVIQVGIPTDREQYIHRLGRTGREGKAGEGKVVLAPWEEYFLDEIKDLPLEKSPLPHLDSDLKAKVEESMARIDTSVKEAAYHAWLGFYNSIREIGRDKTTLVELANRFGDSIGLMTTPALFRKTANKMGLRDIPGIRIRK
ncbi:probable DEAD-box ATP-dependent RNA helicase 48 [Magnolia sinica]|uniref:probable DEAD-box ATP-dependent RNA helicase 48 n=1 Tax=Magnolia sinica TaxID=86752 RepID=UPI00265A6A6D|nr:probable DEAD-box ATP-dependent RNA helicase 48 [Magnolia sinica]